MAKRFFGTDIWQQDWFIDMPSEYKLFWYYILSECDHIGFFKVNIRMFSSLIESKIDPAKALVFFNVDKVRIREVKQNLWFIEDFIFFQYGTSLNPKNRVHDSILKGLEQNGIDVKTIRGLKEVEMGSIRPLNDPNHGVKDKDKDKDKEIELVKRKVPFKENIIKVAAESAGTYPAQLLQEFFDYWTEPNKSRTRMKFEMEATWDTSRRLKTWLRNADKFGPKEKSVAGQAERPYVIGQKHNAAG